MTPHQLDYDFSGLFTPPNTPGLDTGFCMDAELEQARRAIVAAHDEGSLGFMGLVDQQLDGLRQRLDALCEGKNFTQQVVIGIGGSSLGSLAILESATGPLKGLETFFSENIDAHSFAQLLGKLRLAQTLVVVITKSGTTIETMSKFWILYDRMIEELGEQAASAQVIAITDPERGALRPLGMARGFELFEVPPNVGGRFSVLTSVGLVPLVLAGFDVEGLLEGGRAARDHFLASPVGSNSCALMAAHQVALMRAGISQVVMMAYCDRVLPLVDWFRQLWAESLGKRVDRQGRVVHTGITPIKALGVIDQHSQVQLYAQGPNDKHICFLEVEQVGPPLRVPAREGFPEALGHLVGKTLDELLEAELQGTRSALQAAGRPVSRFRMRSGSAFEVGGFIMGWELATAVAGELLDIDAFDQPGVELGKKIAHGLLGRADLRELAASYTQSSSEPEMVSLFC